MDLSIKLKIFQTVYNAENYLFKFLVKSIKAKLIKQKFKTVLVKFKFVFGTTYVQLNP